MTEKIFEFRWIIGGIFILLCTIFEIHGSSISIYADIFQHHELSDIILGRYRPIRSDEYIVFTPFAFSQYFTNFSMISDIVRAAPTNMFMTYGQAVWHPAMIFRPAQIGFLFLDQGSGLAFFWMSRLAILFLISFEFARLILQVNRKLSVLYAIMIAFSPLAQWWWAVNSIAELLAAGQGVVVCWKLYLEQHDNRRRFLYMAGFLWCAGVYIFGIYPAWQVPFGYVFLFCLIAVSLKFSNTLKTLWHDKIFWLVGFAIMLAPIVHAVYVSWDMIQIQMATEYPGKRFTLGGGWSFTQTLAELMTYGTAAILPVKDIWEPTNNCELASFFTMAPLGLLIFFWVTFKLGCRDFLMILLFVITLLLFVWEFTTLPAWLAKFSCMSMVTGNRARSAIDFAQLLMVFRGLSLIKNSPHIFVRIILALTISILSAAVIHNALPEWLGIKKILLVITFTSLSIFLFLTPISRKTFAVLAILMFLIGVKVNPINKGVDVIYKMPVGQKISEIVAQDNKSFWLVEDEGIMMNNFPIMFGAPTINSVNVYPVLERWEQFDQNKHFFKIYNNYAHIIAVLHNEPTTFDMTMLNTFTVKLNPNDLRTLDVKYILSKNGELENFSAPNVRIKKIYEDAGSFIYAVE